MVKKQSWNLRFTRKGFILSVDMIMAVTVVTALLAISFYYYHRSSEDMLARLQIARTGNDIISVLDYDNDLATLNQNTITNAMNQLLPISYNMRIEISPRTGDGFTVGDPLPGGSFIASGKRIFVVKSGGQITDYAIAKFWIWSK